MFCYILVKPLQGRLQPKAESVGSTLGPSLILHGRTEIKARASVLGEVDALSFCLQPPAELILPNSPIQILCL